MNLPNSYRNWMSMSGTVIAICGFLAFFLLLLITSISGSEAVYMGLLIFLITPGFIIGGLLLIPIGMSLERRRMKRTGAVSSKDWPRIDLNIKATRNAVLVFITVTIVFVILTVIGTWKGYHYTESVEFCGKLCHQVMDPEYTTYQNSPHARVKCVECHVGEGADWMVKAKISGIRQVFKSILGTYPRPIPTPIRNLRPARETCEKCHWPQKFYTQLIRTEKYFLADSANTEWNIILKMKIGAEHEAMGNISGSHWHINPNYQIEYIFDDDKRESIPWVKLKDLRSGSETVFVDEENTLADSSLAAFSPRTMDCMDCHNRPSHNFLSPPIYVNKLLAGSPELTNIPWIKKSAMKTLSNIYPNIDSALAGIKQNMTDYYTIKHPEVLKSHTDQIDKAITGVQNAYSKNAFPRMKVTYLDFSQHIGHMETKGCFRCHDDKHKSPEGKVISKDCKLCHTIIGQGEKNKFALTDVNSSLDFIHPIDIGDEWQVSFCSDCHNNLFP